MGFNMSAWWNEDIWQSDKAGAVNSRSLETTAITGRDGLAGSSPAALTIFLPLPEREHE